MTGQSQFYTFSMHRVGLGPCADRLGCVEFGLVKTNSACRLVNSAAKFTEISKICFKDY